MPTACRSTGRRLSTPARRSSSTASCWRNGWASSASSSRSWPTTSCEVKKAELVFADETTLSTLAPGSGSTKTAYLWAYARDDRTFGRSGPPMVAYRFEDSRSGECAVRHLNGYRGILQVEPPITSSRSDRGNDGITLAGCWSHSRRKFYEAACCSSEVARRRSSGRQDSGRSRKPCAVKAQTLALPRASKPPRRSSQISSISGSRPCGGSPANQNWLRRSAMPSRAVPSSKLPDRWWHRAELQHRRTRHQATNNYEKELASSRAATAADEPERPSQCCCRQRK